MISEELVRELIYQTRKPVSAVGRDLLAQIKKVVELKQILILTGVRRCGKSTLLRMIANELVKKKSKNVLYVNFEDERLSGLRVDDFDKILGFFREINLPKGRIFFFLDEIQNIKGWEKWITRRYEQEGKNIKFFISGSNASLLSSEFSTTITGRNIAFSLFPFSFKEFLNAKSVDLPRDISNLSYMKLSSKIRNYFKNYLINGGFPEITFLDDKDIKFKVLQGYFTDIIHRDILFRYDIRDVRYFEDFVKYLLTNFTSQFSYNALEKNFEYGINTIIRYISHLEQSFLIGQTSLFSYSLKKQQVNPKKFYCIDNGLRNAVSFKFSKDEGKLAENLVFVELKRRDKDVYYWKNKSEVDFVIKQKDQSLIGINVTYSDEIDEREIKGLKEFKDNFKSKARELIILTRDIEKKQGDIKFVPLWKWLLEIKKDIKVK